MAASVNIPMARLPVFVTLLHSAMATETPSRSLVGTLQGRFPVVGVLRKREAEGGAERRAGRTRCLGRPCAPEGTGLCAGLGLWVFHCFLNLCYIPVVRGV